MMWIEAEEGIEAVEVHTEKSCNGCLVIRGAKNTYLGKHHHRLIEE
jgi:hypothetical protein